MKSTNLWRKAPAGALVAALITVGGAGAYTAANWFGATADNAQQADNILSVDLSGCKRDLPGIQENTAGTALFETTSASHISAQDLQQRLLAGCEYYAITDFFMEQSPYSVRLKEPYATAQNIYGLASGTIQGINPDHTITITYRPLGSSAAKDMRLRLSGDAVAYKERTPSSFTTLGAGTHVVFVYKLAGTFEQNRQKYGDVSQLQPEATIVSLHTATTDVKNSVSQKDFYKANNIRPLGSEEKPAQR